MHIDCVEVVHLVAGIAIAVVGLIMWVLQIAAETHYIKYVSFAGADGPKGAINITK